MKNALLGEYRKLMSTRLWWILLLVLAGYMAFMGLVLGFSITADQPDGTGPLATGSDAAISVYSVINGIGYVFPLIVGSLAMTTEFRHHTITQSLLVEPRRSVFLGAKLLATLPVGLLYGLVGTAAVVAAGAPMLATQGDGAFLGDSEVLTGLFFGVVVTVLWAMIGVSFGSLVTNQVAAIVIILAFTQFVEPIARALFGAVDSLNELSKFLPGAAADAVIGGSFFAGFGGEVELLSRWAGLLVLVAYAVAIALLGRLTTLRHDLV